MTKWQLARTVAGEFLDAANHVLDHLSRARMGDTELGDDPDLLRDLYGGVRRLRNYLERGLRDWHGEACVEFDLTLEDQNLLVSCAMFEIGECDSTINDLDRDSVGVNRARAIQDNMIEWAIEFATREPLRVPTVNPLGSHSLKVQSLLTAIRAKLHPGPDLRVAAAPPPSMRLTVSDELDGSPGIGLDVGGFDDVDPIDPGPVDADDGSASIPVDGRRLRHPKLRTLLMFDVKAFERSLIAKDYRLAMLHLAAVFEAVVTDVALQNQESLNLHGPPEAWSMEHILRGLMGEDFSPTDHAHLAQLIAARNLNRPAVLINSSTFFTATSIGGVRAFANRVFSRLGLLPEARRERTPR